MVILTTYHQWHWIRIKKKYRKNFLCSGSPIVANATNEQICQDFKKNVFFVAVVVTIIAIFDFIVENKRCRR